MLLLDLLLGLLDSDLVESGLADLSQGGAAALVVAERLIVLHVVYVVVAAAGVALLARFGRLACNSPAAALGHDHGCVRQLDVRGLSLWLPPATSTAGAAARRQLSTLRLAATVA